MTAEAFFKELQRLIYSQPKLPAYVYLSENCEYGNHVYFSKNLLHCFDCSRCSDCLHLYDSFRCVQCVDCDYAVESHMCYESVDPFKCFNSSYLNYCSNTHDAAYCYDCINCHDVFGCMHLRNKSFCIFNRQLEEKEYHEVVKRYAALPPEKVLSMLDTLKLQYPITQTIGAHNQNSQFGNYIHYNKNCYYCFDAAHNENGAYLFDTFHTSGCMDTTYIGQKTELSYEIVDSDNLFNCNYILYSDYLSDCSYCFNATLTMHCLGCVGIKNKNFCILNRQLDKPTYEKLSSEILSDIAKKNISWHNVIF